ncbi:MAG: hypothetical protein ABSF90_18650 [Syntrophobacteraceae bacterium]|jgi:hypothetical protein
MPDTTLKLGSFIFREIEIPEEIGFGGTQKLHIHELIGGVRQVDALGRREKDLEWSGLIQGPDAMDRALYLDTLRIQGNALPLTWGRLAYSVVIEEFEPRYQRYYQIPYRIKFVVVDNLTAPVAQVNNTGLDDQISADMTTAGTQVAAVADTTLTGLFATFQAAVAGVTSFVNLAASAAAVVVQSLAAVQTRVVTLEALFEGVIAENTSIGMVGALPLVTAADIEAAMAAMNQMQALVSLAGTLGRIQKNVVAVSQTSNTVVTAGGDLFHIAASQYQQAQAWTTIAAANGLMDPVIQGIQTLTVPGVPDGNDGVLES